MLVFDKQPVNRLASVMNQSVGISDVKTKFSELCEQVARTGKGLWSLVGANAWYALRR